MRNIGRRGEKRRDRGGSSEEKRGEEGGENRDERGDRREERGEKREERGWKERAHRTQDIEGWGCNATGKGSARGVRAA